MNKWERNYGIYASDLVWGEGGVVVLKNCIWNRHFYMLFCFLDYVFQLFITMKILVDYKKYHLMVDWNMQLNILRVKKEDTVSYRWKMQQLMVSMYFFSILAYFSAMDMNAVNCKDDIILSPLFFFSPIFAAKIKLDYWFLLDYYFQNH